MMQTILKKAIDLLKGDKVGDQDPQELGLRVTYVLGMLETLLEMQPTTTITASPYIPPFYTASGFGGVLSGASMPATEAEIMDAKVKSSLDRIKGSAHVELA